MVIVEVLPLLELLVEEFSCRRPLSLADPSVKGSESRLGSTSKRAVPTPMMWYSRSRSKPNQSLQGGGISHGRLCLDFVAATRALIPNGEASKQDLSRWVLEHRMSRHFVPVGTATLQDAIALREAIEACVGAAIGGQGFPEASRACINRFAMMPASPQLEQTEGAHLVGPPSRRGSAHAGGTRCRGAVIRGAPVSDPPMPRAGVRHLVP